MKKIGIFLLIALFVVGCYFGYQYYQQWEAKKFNEIEFLKRNQDMIVQRITDLSTTLTKVMGETVKVQTLPKEDATYEGLKTEVLKLKEDEEANKEEIARLREELSKQRQAFLGSEDRILINTTAEEQLLIYRDEKGALQPASANITKIIEHREDKDKSIPVTIEEARIVEKARSGLKAGGYYSFDKNYGVIISKGIFSIKDYSFNASLLLHDFENFKLIVGGDIAYEFRDNLELAIGYNTEKEFYGALRWSF